MWSVLGLEALISVQGVDAEKGHLELGAATLKQRYDDYFGYLHI